MRFHLDFETASKVDLPEVGSHLYCTHPSTRITHITARMHGEEQFIHWRFDRTILGTGTEENQAAIDTLISWLLRAEDRSIVAHHAAFEYAVLKGVFQRQFRVDLSHLEPRHMDCTMARALVQGFPGSLDKAAAALDVGLSKDKPGAAALTRLRQPAKAYEEAHGGPVYWWELDPLAIYQQELDAALVRLGKRAKQPKDREKEVAKLRVKASEKAAAASAKWIEDAELVSAYNIQDVVVEEAIDAKLPPLPDSEFETWCIDQALNLRGVTLNVPLIKLLDDSVQLALQRADAAIAEITNGDISKASQSGAIAQWLNDRGLLCTGVSKDKIDGLRAQAFLLEDEAAAKVIDIRKSAGQAAVKKLATMLRTCDENHTSRNLLQYYGAATGRWAGRLWQPQNLKRLQEDALARFDSFIGGCSTPEEVLEACERLDIDFFSAVGDAMRSFMIAPPGMHLVSGDFSNIEGRGNAWLAGEQWKLDAFAAYDRGDGHDLYKLAYARAFQIDPKDVTKDQRQYGKVMELACGYQGGVGAFQKMAVNLGVSVPDPVAQTLVDGWREGHPAIKSSWRAYQDAAIEAVKNPGVPQWCVDGKIGYIFQHNVLYVRVPAGGFIVYPYAHIVWEDKFGSGKQSPVVKYKGVDSVTRQWVTKTLYGGLQCENVTQRVARDVMDQKIKAALKAGIDVRLHVHDELIAVDKDPGRAAELEAIMCEPLDWCPGFPIAAACWSDTRYIK